MSKNPKIELSRLREIGWSQWDPIGLASHVSGDDDPAADEYDSYLLHVAGSLRRGGTEDECVRYLKHIEAEHMGIGVLSDAGHRATQTVRAIKDYLFSLPDGPLGVR